MDSAIERLNNPGHMNYSTIATLIKMKENIQETELLMIRSFKSK